MNKVNDKKLKEIKGGGINLSLMASWGAALSFIVGVIDGLINPKKCNN